LKTRINSLDFEVKRSKVKVTARTNPLSWRSRRPPSSYCI